MRTSVCPLTARACHAHQTYRKELEGGASRKRRKVEGAGLNVSLEAWDAFEQSVKTFEVQHVQGKSKFAFAFVEGPLVKALRNGDW